MAVVDVASLGVRIEAEGVDATQAALRGIEAQGERVSRAVGNLTARVSVTGTDTVAASTRRISETVAGVGTASAAATRAVTTDAAARSAALAKEAESAERAARRAEEAVQRRQSAVERAHAAEVAAVRGAGGDPDGVDPAVRRASDRAEQQLDTAQRKAADLQAAASRAREAAEAAARAIPAAPLAPVVSAAPVAERALAGVKAGADATAASVTKIAQAAPAAAAAVTNVQVAVAQASDAVLASIREMDRAVAERRRAAAAEQAEAQRRFMSGDVFREPAAVLPSPDLAAMNRVGAPPVRGAAGGAEAAAAGSARLAAVSDTLAAAIARSEAAVTAAGDAAVEAARESAALTAVLDREADAARRAAAEEAALAQARQRAGTVAPPSPSGPRSPAAPRELGPATSTTEANPAAVARNVAAERSAAALGETVARVTRVVQEQGAALDATNARAVAAFRNSTDAAAAYLVKLGATDAQIDALGASIAEVEARAASAATKIGAKGAATERAGTIAGASATKFRSAANGITAVAFAATAGGGSMQSMALAAGLAASSMAQLSGAAGAVAGGIGAAITVGVALVGVLDQIRQKRQQALLTDAVDPRYTRSADDARRSLAQLDRQADLLRGRITELKNTTFQFGNGGFGWEGAILGPIRAAERELRDVEERSRQVRRQVAEPRAAEEAEQRRQAVVGGLRAENAAIGDAAAARLATERTAYDQGRSDLASYSASRVAAVRAGAAREIAELRAQQRALRDDTGREPGRFDNTETKAQRDARLAEATQLDSAIRAARSRAAGEEASANADRESQARALRDRLIGYEIEVATARGDQARATALRIQQQAEAQQRTLAQQVGSATPDAQRQAAEYRATLELAADAAEAQRVLAREQNALGAKRAEIQAQVTKGTLTEVDGQRAIAAAERERLPALNAQLAILERLALALNNPDLLAFVRQMRGELAGWGDALTPLQERMKAVFNDLAARATAMTDAVRAKIDELVSKAGGVVTPKIAIQAEWMSGMASSINEQWAMMGVNAGAVFVDSIRAGIEGFGSGPITFGSFFKNMGNTLLAGLGGVMAEMGAQLLVMGGVMTGLLPFFSNPITAGPAMLIAGGILLTAGAALGAIATRNRGGGGGGGGAISAPANFDQSASVILTPRAAGKAPEPARPIIQHFTVLGDTPEVQRFISKVTVSASRRGMPVGATG